nr:hypothetical protein [uncultured Niameybacter sp.]
MNTLKIKSLTIEEIEQLEKLNATFRDALISFREYRYHGGGQIDENILRNLQESMKLCVQEAKTILAQNNIQDLSTLKEMSNKYFMIEFLNGVFDTEIYAVEDEIDCGL